MSLYPQYEEGTGSPMTGRCPAYAVESEEKGENLTLCLSDHVAPRPTPVDPYPSCAIIDNAAMIEVDGFNGVARGTVECMKASVTD